MRYRMMADAAELLSAGLATLINKPFEGGGSQHGVRAISEGVGLGIVGVVLDCCSGSDKF